MTTEPTGYRGLAARLRAEITSGTWPPGHRVPSEQDLMQTYGLARETVRRALAELRVEGLIVVRHGHPTRVRPAVERTEVRVQRGSTWVVRMPTPQERDELGLDQGVPVLEVTYGARTTVHPGDRHVFRNL